MRTALTSLSIALIATACTSLSTEPERDGSSPPNERPNEVVHVSDVLWDQLNPARGDKSPRAGTLWGDRKDIVPTGYLIRFEDGFSSPQHIHNVSYRGVVIEGLVHNDDPGAAPMWMPAGSFWTQPKGEVHITSAKGAGNMAYIEIDRGPYLVWPTVRAFDSGERPINVDASNIVWLDAKVLRESTRPDTPEGTPGPKVAFLWGVPGELHGAFVELPAGFSGQIASHGESFKAIVIRGQPNYGDDAESRQALAPGSYFGSEGVSRHTLSSEASSETMLYVRCSGRFEVNGR